MGLRAKGGFDAVCECGIPCGQMVELPHKSGSLALKTLLDDFKWRRIQMDGEVKLLAPKCVDRILQERISKGLGPLTYV